MEPGDVTHVLLSHLHFDHCGGIVRRRASGKLEAAFPRAQIFVQSGELGVATNSGNERLRAAYRHVHECLEPVRPAIVGLDGDTELIDGVTAAVSGGHTRDHQVAVVRSRGEAFIHLADIVPTRSHMRGPWNQAYDLDALTTMECKARYLAQAIEHGWWLAFAHDEQVLAAQVKRDRGRIVLDTTIARGRLQRLRSSRLRAGAVRPSAARSAALLMDWTGPIVAGPRGHLNGEALLGKLE